MKIGILGGGQLARMLALAAHPLGIETLVYEPKPQSSAHFVTQTIQGEFNDQDKLRYFCDQVDRITFETENIPQETAAFVDKHGTLVPNLQALTITQDRLLEKTFFNSHNIPTAPYLPVANKGELKQACDQLGLPTLLKTRLEGYDGKGQYWLRTEQAIEAAPDSGSFIVEKIIDFNREISLVGARDGQGNCVFYPISDNQHHQGILHKSQVIHAAPLLQAQAETYMKTVLEALDYVGVLAIEFFQVGETLIANEMAPRVHNTGHWTIEGAYTSQFENHIRALADLPLGLTTLRGPSVMINCLGNMPSSATICAIPYAHYHHYQKSSRPQRKVGHITVCAPTPEELSTSMRQVVAIMS